MNRILLIQCCRPPHFFWVAKKLRQRHPDCCLEALVCSGSELSHCPEGLALFERVHEAGKGLAEYDCVVFPLLNSGYPAIKRSAFRMPFPAFEADYQGELTPLKTARLVRSLWSGLHRPPGEFFNYYENFSLPPLGRKVLLLETAHPSLIEKTRKRWESLLPEEAQVERMAPDSFFSALGKARARQFDSAVIFLSGEQGYSTGKILPFVLGLRRILVINEQGSRFYADVRSMVRFILHRIITGSTPPTPAPRVLFVQTEAPRHVAKAVARLKTDLYPHARITLLCRRDDSSHFASDPHVDRVWTYSRGGLREALRLRTEIKEEGFDLACALLSGRSYFRKPKGFFLSLPIRHRLVFNAQFDCYPVRLRTLPWLLRRNPFPWGADLEVPQRVLLIQTAGPTEVLQALSILKQSDMLPTSRIAVFCPESFRSAFEPLESVEEVFSYEPGRKKRNLQVLHLLVGWKPDVVCGLFTGQPIFRKQKLLFFLLPSRYRLVFNENLDCFYFSWRQFHRLIKSDYDLRLLLRLLRACLFLPRFLFLLVWWGGMLLRKRWAKAG